ncbi:hypothetical protein J3R30DRAFT_945840 [Lentinula aciculospora]|uniref:Extracellular mutant protein 11 C-terminal domain-containing protein n=1 Tax=Lentinula aciculospora TaxID=153920 RepID=A0A9W9DWC8_9AGAR|nr:hypothetical protein J3R30DRAFT_945840 [Lentinula aciculospora]
MSARTPFIPNNSRPASSAAHNKDNASSTSVEDAPFAPDINSPLHADMLKLSPSLQIPHSNKGLATSDQKPTANNMPKSTNLNGLLKKSSGSQGGLNLSGRKSNSNQANSANESPSLLSITKTLSGRRDQSGTPSVFAPKPLNAVSAADLLSSSAFKTPTLPNSSVTNLQVTNEAHIPINNEENSHPASQYKFGKAPPQRVLLQGDDSIPGSMIGLIPKHGHRDHDRASKKRGRVELDPDDMIYANHMDSGPAKRYKTNAPMQVGLDTRSYMEGEIECLTHPQSRFSPQLLSSPIERTESPQSARHGPHDYQQHSSPSEHHTTGFDQHQRQYFQRMTLDPAGEGSGGESGIHPPSLSNGSSVSVERGGDALDKLLGCHADAYIEDHMDKYEQLATKWKECSMEEWVKGSDEIMAKYVKIMDFVKNHMTTKLKLFTSFDQQLEAHNAVLDERAKVLDGVKSKLVAQSGSILA